MIVAEKFIRSLVEKYGKHIVYTDGGTWYHEACNIIGLKCLLHNSFKQSIFILFYLSDSYALKQVV